MRTTTITIFCLILSVFCFSQSKKNLIEVSGTFADSLNQAPLSFMPFQIYASKIDSSSLVGNYLADDKGTFKVQIPKQNISYFLVTSSGFHQPTSVSFLGESNQKLGVIVVQDLVLEGVDITASPSFKDGQKTVFSVSSMNLPEGVPITSIIKVAPNISEDANGDLKIGGQKEVKIYLDGREISKQTFESIPTSSIENLEIIANPPLSENAGKSGILNIVTKKDIILSKGSVGGTVGFLRELYSGSASYTLKNKKNFLHLNIPISKVIIIGDNELERTRIGETNPLLYQKGDYRSQNIVYGADLTFFHQLTDSWETNAQLYIQQAQPSVNNDLLTENRLNNTQNIFFNELRRDEITQYVMGEVIKKLPSKSQVRLVARRYEHRTNSIYDNKNNGSLIRSENDVTESVFSTQLSHQLKLSNARQLEYGLIFINTQSISNFITKIQNSDGSFVNIGNNNGFVDFDRKDGYFFANYRFSWLGLEWDLEGRLERTTNIVRYENEVFEQDFWNFVPQISLFKETEKLGTFTLTYQRNLYRPQAGSFNTFVAVTNPNFSTSGNSSLANELEHSISLNHFIEIKKVSLETTLSYNYLNDAIIYRTFATDSLFEKNYVNINHYQNLSLNVSLSTRLSKKLSINTSLYGENFDYDDSFEDNAFSNGYRYSLSAYLAYISTKRWVFTLGTSYFNYEVEFQQKETRLPRIQFGVNKSFFKNRLNANLSVLDIFNINGKTTSTYDDFTYQQIRQNNLLIRSIDVSLRYNFGKKFKDSRMIRGIRTGTR